MQENCHMMSCVAGGYVGLKSEQQKRHYSPSCQRFYNGFFSALPLACVPNRNTSYTCYDISNVAQKRLT